MTRVGAKPPPERRFLGQLGTQRLPQLECASISAGQKSVANRELGARRPSAPTNVKNDFDIQKMRYSGRGATQQGITRTSASTQTLPEPSARRCSSAQQVLSAVRDGGSQKGSQLCAMKSRDGSEVSRPCAMEGRSEASHPYAIKSHSKDSQPCAMRGRSGGPRLCETTSRSEDSPLCATMGPGEDLQLCALKAWRRVAYARQRIAANTGEEPRRCAARLFAAEATRGRSCRSCRCDCRPRQCGTPQSRRRPRAESRDRR